MPNNFGNIANVISGPCLIYVDDGTGERNVGLTKGDVEYVISPDVREQKFHQFGEQPIGWKVQGMSGMVKFTAAEYTKANLKLAMPWATLYTDGADQALGHGSGSIGSELTAGAVQIRIHPINKLGTNGDDDATYLSADVTFWKVVNMKEQSRKVTSSEDRVIDIELKAVPDSTKSAPHDICFEGDPDVASIDIAPPTVTSVKAEKTNVLTLVPADAAGLADVDADTTIELILAEECRSWMALAKYFSVIKDADKTVVAGAFVHSVVAGAPNTSKVVFTPTAPLTAGAAYQVLVGGIADVTGNVMASITQRKFTVAA